MKFDNKKIISILSGVDNKNIWIKVGILLDGYSDKPFFNANIVFNEEKIIFVSNSVIPPEEILIPGQKEPDLELPDYTLLPGLIDAHAHLFLEGSESDNNKRKIFQQQPFDLLLSSASLRIKKLFQFGIIAVRDAGDKFGVGLALSKLYNSKEETDMPYLDSPGAAINHSGNYGRFMSDPIENYPSLFECVKARVDNGASRIKLIATGIIDFKEGRVKKPPQMSAEEIAAFVSAAKSFNRQTFAHASGDNGIDNVIAGGVNSVEHGFFIRSDQLAKMRDRQIAWVPTFAPVQAQLDNKEILGLDEKTTGNLEKILEQHLESLNKAQNLGAEIIAGSDAGSYAVLHGAGLLSELELMARSGLSILKIINSATGKSSTHLNFQEKFGRIHQGYKSRFILTKHSPLKNISNFRKEKFIIFDGKIFYFDGNPDLEGL